MTDKITALRQPTEEEMKELFDLYDGGYAPDGIIQDLEEMFAMALNGAREAGDRVTMDMVNAYWGIRQVAKVLRYFDPLNHE